MAMRELALDLKAYALRAVFDSAGRLGGALLNRGLTKGLDIFPNLHYGPHVNQRLDILRNKAPAQGRLPVLVYFHGGGWISADKKIYQGIAATFSRNGFLTFNVNYRLAPKNKFSAPLQDAAQAMDWVCQNAAQYGGDCSLLVLAGDSAGAQIASWYASALQNESLFHQIGVTSATRKAPVTSLLLFYGVYDFDTVLDASFPFIKTYARSSLGADVRKYAKSSKLASPIRQVSPHLPPIWLCAGERDGLFAQSKAYAEALERCGVHCRTLFFSRKYRANHGFLFFGWLRSSKAAVAGALEFVEEVFAVEREATEARKRNG